MLTSEKWLHQTTAEQVREHRTHRGMTQQNLADRLSIYGAKVDRTAIAKIEAGKRVISLQEAFTIALALDVAPVHLLVPIDSDEPIRLAPNLEASPYSVRAWIRGAEPMFQDPRVYFLTVPLTETKLAGEALAAWEQTTPIKVTTSPQGESPSPSRKGR